MQWPGEVASRGGPGVPAERGRSVMEASWLSVLRFLLWKVSLKCQRCLPSLPRHYHNSPAVFAFAFQSAVPSNPQILLPGLPTLNLMGCKRLPGFLGVLQPRCWMPCPPSCSCWVVRWSLLVPIPLPGILSWCDLGKG